MKRNTFYPLSNSMFSFPFEISSESLCSSYSTSILYIIVFPEKMEVISIPFFFLISHQNYLEQLLQGNIILSSTYLKLLSASTHHSILKLLSHFLGICYNSRPLFSINFSICQFWLLFWEYHRLGDLNRNHSFFMVLKTGMFMATGDSGSADGWLLLGPPMAFLWGVRVKRERECMLWSLQNTHLNIEVTNFMVSFQPDYLPRVSPPSTIMVVHDFGGTHTSSL